MALNDDSGTTCSSVWVSPSLCAFVSNLVVLASFYKEAI